MQLSVSTTSTDSNFAATGAPARRPAAGDTALLDAKSPGGDPSDFADLLSDAAPATAGSKALAAPLDGAAHAGPATAAATLAIFPNWLGSTTPGDAPSLEINSSDALAGTDGIVVCAVGTQNPPKASAGPLVSPDAVAATSVSPVKVVDLTKPLARRSAAGLTRGAKIASGDMAVPATAAPTVATANVEAVLAAAVAPTGVALLPQPETSDVQQPTAGESGIANKNFTALPASPSRTPALVSRVAMPATDSPFDRLTDLSGPVLAPARPGTAPSPELPAQDSSREPPAPLPAMSDAVAQTILAPANRPENSLPASAEIFAAVDGKMTAEKKIAPGAPEKTFLNATGKRVVGYTSDLGIGVAKSESAMPTAMFSNRAMPVAPLGRVPEPSAVTTSAAPAPVAPEEPMLTAYRAVDAVLTAVERFNAGDRHAVQLHFSVGGSDLSVHVEMRGQEVRTTFRTDSPELRTALAHEWQAASAGAAERPLRLAPPIFSAPEHAGFSAFAGDTASDQRGARAHPQAGEFLAPSAARAAPAFAAVVDDLPASSSYAAAPNTARHLSTIA